MALDASQLFDPPSQAERIFGLWPIATDEKTYQALLFFDELAKNAKFNYPEINVY